MSPPANSVAGFLFSPRRFSQLNMELDLQPGDVVKVLESAALGWVRARVIRVKSGGRVVVQSDQGREFTARGNQVRLIEPAGFRP
jgi:hypothetical protein